MIGVRPIPMPGGGGRPGGRVTGKAPGGGRGRPGGKPGGGGGRFSGMGGGMAPGGGGGAGKAGGGGSCVMVGVMDRGRSRDSRWNHKIAQNIKVTVILQKANTFVAPRHL